jgi:hypothetical protein
MYLKIRRDRLRDNEHTTSLRFEILQAYRDPVTQRPRNKFIAYLGSFRESDLNKSTKRELFWMKVNDKLAQLNLSQSDENKLRSKLLEMVPRPESLMAIISSLL